jgi:hypothetical protein
LCIFIGEDMKTVTLTFPASAVGVANLGPNAPSTNPYNNTLTSQNLLLNTDNISAKKTIQTIFSGTAPTYTIQANLGMIDNSALNSPTLGEVIIDPLGWVDILTLQGAYVAQPTTPLTAGILLANDTPIFALRVNISAVGTGLGYIKVLQQGISS